MIEDIQGWLAELRAEEPAPPMPVSVTPLDWERSHGEVDPSPEVLVEPAAEPIPEPEEHPAALGDPPSVAAATAGPGAGEAEPSGASVPMPCPPLLDHEASIWALLTQPDGHGQPQDLSDLLTVLAASPELRSAALLRSMERFRDQLDQLPGRAPLDQPVTIAAADLMVLTRALLGRLR